MGGSLGAQWPASLTYLVIHRPRRGHVSKIKTATRFPQNTQGQTVCHLVMNVTIALIQELRAALVPVQDQPKLPSKMDQHSRRWLTGLGGGFTRQNPPPAEQSKQIKIKHKTQVGREPMLGAPVGSREWGGCLQEVEVELRGGYVKTHHLYVWVWERVNKWYSLWK